MATISSTQDGNWVDGATWVGGVKPGAADDANILHAVTVSAAEACQGFGVSVGGVLTISAGQSLDCGAVGFSTAVDGTLNIAGTLYVAGDVVLPAGRLGVVTGSIVFDHAAGAFTLTSAANTLPATTITNPTVTSFTLLDDLTVGGAFTIPAGGAKLAVGAFGVYCTSWGQASGTLTGTGSIRVVGNITITAGTISGLTGTWFVTGVCTYTVANLSLSELNVGAAAVLTPAAGAQYCKKLSGSGTVAAGGGWLDIWPAVDDFWDFTGTYSPASLVIYANTSRSTGAGIDAPSATSVSFVGTTGATMTMDGALTAALAVVGVLGLSGAGNQVSTLVLNSAGAAVKGFFIGSDGDANRDGTLTLAGNVLIGTSGIDIGSLTANILNFGSACVPLAGTIEATGATCTNVSGVVVGGTVQNVDLSASNQLIAITSADGGGTNANILFLAGLPGGEMACGVGIAA